MRDLKDGPALSARICPGPPPSMREPGLLSVAEEKDLRHGQRVRMRNGEKRGLHAHPAGAIGCAPVQPQLRGAGHPEYLDVFPEHASRVTSAERFHRGFLGGESAGEMGDGVSTPRTIGNLAFGEDAAQKTIAVAFERRTDARNIGGVESKSKNIHASASA